MRLRFFPLAFLVNVALLSGYAWSTESACATSLDGESGSRAASEMGVRRFYESRTHLVPEASQSRYFDLVDELLREEISSSARLELAGFLLNRAPDTLPRDRILFAHEIGVSPASFKLLRHKLAILTGQRLNQLFDDVPLDRESAVLLMRGMIAGKYRAGKGMVIQETVTVTDRAGNIRSVTGTGAHAGEARAKALAELRRKHPLVTNNAANTEYGEFKEVKKR